MSYMWSTRLSCNVQRELLAITCDKIERNKIKKSLFRFTRPQTEREGQKLNIIL